MSGAYGEMLDPRELLDLATELATSSGSAVQNPARRCRAVSTAYYALFHALLRRAADEFVGRRHQGEASYTLLYRGFAHARMKQVCEELDKPSLRPVYRDKLKRAAVSPAVRYLATTFVELQEARHRADYDPDAATSDADAARACLLADFGMKSLAQADSAEIRDILALMLMDQRR